MKRCPAVAGLGLLLSVRAGARRGPRRSATPRPTSRCRARTARPTASPSYKGKRAVVLAWFPKAFTGG